MEPIGITEVAYRLGAALVLGGLLGLERERKNRPAGFRTMILISLGSAGFMIAGQEAIRAVAADQNAVLTSADISRVIQGLIGGIGFLGAGAVLHNKKAVRGLTTAAAVWVTSCVGASAGLGLIMLAAVLSGFALFTLIVLEWVENHYFPEVEEESKKNGDSVIQITLDRDGRPLHRE